MMGVWETSWMGIGSGLRVIRFSFEGLYPALLITVAVNVSYNQRTC
jgi:hypothetical protein